MPSAMPAPARQQRPTGPRLPRRAIVAAPAARGSTPSSRRHGSATPPPASPRRSRQTRRERPTRSFRRVPRHIEVVVDIPLEQTNPSVISLVDLVTFLAKVRASGQGDVVGLLRVGDAYHRLAPTLVQPAGNLPGPGRIHPPVVLSPRLHDGSADLIERQPLCDDRDGMIQHIVDRLGSGAGRHHDGRTEDQQRGKAPPNEHDRTCSFSRGYGLSKSTIL